MNMRLLSHSEKETAACGGKFARGLRPKDVVILEGELGGGKTTFVRGLVSGLGYRGRVLSPSFTLIREYHLPKLTVYHVDLYRLSAGETDKIGLDEALYAPGSIVLIEWGDKIRHQLPRYFRVGFSFIGPESRRLKFSAKGQDRNNMPQW